MNSILVKELSHVNFFMISCTRFFIIMMMSSPITMHRIDVESPFPSGKRWLLFWRSIIGASNLMIHFYAVQVSTYIFCFYIDYRARGLTKCHFKSMALGMGCVQFLIGHLSAPVLFDCCN